MGVEGGDGVEGDWGGGERCEGPGMPGPVRDVGEGWGNRGEEEPKAMGREEREGRGGEMVAKREGEYFLVSDNETREALLLGTGEWNSGVR